MMKYFSGVYEAVTGESKRKTMLAKIFGVTAAIVIATCSIAYCLCRLYKKYISADIRKTPFKEDFDACLADDCDDEEDTVPDAYIEVNSPDIADDDDILDD